MAVLIFITSTGFVIVEHECQIKGKVTSLFTQNHSCYACKKTKVVVATAKQSVHRRSCCSLKNTYKQLKINVQVSKKQIVESNFPEVLMPKNFFFGNQALVLELTKSHLLPLPKGPPISCKLRIQLNQSFLI